MDLLVEDHTISGTWSDDAGHNHHNHPFRGWLQLIGAIDTTRLPRPPRHHPTPKLRTQNRRAPDPTLTAPGRPASERTDS